MPDGGPDGTRGGGCERSGGTAGGSTGGSTGGTAGGLSAPGAAEAVLPAAAGAGARVPAALTRALRALPPGTPAVAAGTAVLGAASYAHLAVAGHALPPDAMADVSVLWTLVMSLGLGLFLPVEQELTRLVAARDVRGGGVAPVVRRGARLAAAMAAGALAVLAVLAVGAKPLTGRLFGGGSAFVLALGAAFVGMAACHVVRGVLAGLGAFGAYGVNLALDGGLRAGTAGGLALAGVGWAPAYGLVLAVAPMAAAVFGARRVLRAVRPGAAPSAEESFRGLGPLVCSTLLAQSVVNLSVVSARILAPHEAALIGALLAALVLARVPLFVFGALQASLLSGLSSTAAAGDGGAYRRLLWRTCAVVCLLGVAGGLPATVLGPWLIRVLFDAPEALGVADFACLAAGTLCYMLAMVLGQAAITLGRHRVQLGAWAAGTLVFAAVTALPGPVGVRVEAAYAAGSLAVALLLFLILRRSVISPESHETRSNTQEF